MLKIFVDSLNITTGNTTELQQIISVPVQVQTALKVAEKWGRVERKEG
jgi:hypothetical protein